MGYKDRVLIEKAITKTQIEKKYPLTRANIKNCIYNSAEVKGYMIKNPAMQEEALSTYYHVRPEYSECYEVHISKMKDGILGNWHLLKQYTHDEKILETANHMATVSEKYGYCKGKNDMIDSNNEIWGQNKELKARIRELEAELKELR